MSNSLVSLQHRNDTKPPSENREIGGLTRADELRVQYHDDRIRIGTVVVSLVGQRPAMRLKSRKRSTNTRNTFLEPMSQEIVVWPGHRD